MLTKNTKKPYYTPDNIEKILPERLKFFRKRIGLTTIDVAKTLNKTASAVTLWETGKSLPDIVTLLKLCRLYKVSDLNEFLETTVAPEINSLSRNEQNLVMFYRKAPKSVQGAIETILKECID